MDLTAVFMEHDCLLVARGITQVFFLGLTVNGGYITLSYHVASLFKEGRKENVND